MRLAVLLSIGAAITLGCGQRTVDRAANARPAAATKKSADRASRPAASPLDDLEARGQEDPRRSAADEPAAGPTTHRWRVVSVHDGDTVLCLDDDNRRYKVRIVGIDAPEIGQAFGTVSRDGLRALVLRKSVTVLNRGADRYGRTLGSLEIDGQDVARSMVSAGLAWHFVRYSDDADLAAAEREAREARRGLWADRDPMPPWDWRETERDRKPAKRASAAR